MPQGASNLWLSVAVAALSTALFGQTARQPTKVPGERDVTLDWRVVETPMSKAKWGWFLEFACGDVITGFSVDGRKTELVPSKEEWWPGAERGAILPAGDSHEIAVEEVDSTILYPNGVGRVTLSPVTIDRALELKAERIPGRVSVANVCPMPVEGEMTARFTDFFGVELSRQVRPLRLAPGERRRVDFTAPEKYWKIEYRVNAGGEMSRPYWFYHDAKQWFTAREDKIHFKERFPVQFDPEKEKSHTRKFVFTADVPSSFAGKRIMLGVPAVHYKAEFKVNGEPVGEIFLWETPGKIDITDHVKPGEELRLEAVVTDASVAASKNWKPSSPGSQPNGFRALTAAVGHYPLGRMSGFRSRLVLLAENVVATEEVAIVPELRGGCKILKAAVKTRGEAQARFAIYDRGRLVKNLDAGSRVWRVDELEFWTPDNPKLYEFRVTLLQGGSVVDVSRWRFGFRTTGIEGRHFTFNGRPFRYLGFSQIYLPRMVWPALPPPCNFARWHFHDDTHGMGGAAMANIADELGVLIKGENLAHNAHGNERYDYGQELTWRRLESEMKHVISALRNSPSIAFWDLGNETTFSKPGEPERCGKLMEDIRRFDPTRHVTVSGSLQLPKGEGVRIHDYHGHVGFGGDADMIARSDKPIMFSESMYMHARMIPGMAGEDMFFANRLGQSYGKLPTILGRRYMIRQCRRSKVAASLGHVSRFHGREVSPVSAATADERLRFFSGDDVEISLDVYNHVSRRSRLDVALTLCSSNRVLAASRRSADMDEFDEVRLDFDLGKYDFGVDGRLMLFIDVDSDDGAAYRDMEEVAVYRRIDPVVPKGVKLSVCDPEGSVVEWLRGRNVEFAELSSPREWKGLDGEVLYLFNCDDANAVFSDLPAIADVDSHGVFPYAELGPKFKKSDLRWWRGGGGGFRVARRLMRLPDRGNFRTLAAGSDRDGVRFETAALADFAVKSGMVRVSRIDFKSALGREPASERLLAHLVANPPRKFGAPGTSVWVGKRMRKAMASQAGVYEFLETEKLPDLSATARLVVDGKNYARLRKEIGGELSRWLNGGGRLLVFDAPRGERFALGRARIAADDELLSGLSSGDFFWFDGKGGTDRTIKSYDESRGDDAKAIGTHLVEMASGDVPLIEPAYIVRRGVGRGSVHLTTLDLMRSPAVEARRVLSAMLTNFGVRLDCAEAGRRMLADGRLADWEREMVESPSRRRVFARPVEVAKIEFRADGAAKARIWYEDRKEWIPGMPEPFDDFSMAGGVAGGIYEWRNPSRERKVVEVEIASGDVRGYTVHRQKEPAELGSLLPGFSPEDVLCRREWGDFGIVVAKDGSVPLVYLHESGQPLLELRRTFVQSRRDVDGKPRHRTLENAPKTASFSMRDDVLCVTNVGKWADTFWEYRFRAGGFDLKMSAVAKWSPAEGERVNLFYGGRCLGAEWSGGTANVRPLVAEWPEMSLSLDYTQSLRWHKGYWTGRNGSFTFTPLNTGTKTFKAGEEGSVRLSFDFR